MTKFLREFEVSKQFKAMVRGAPSAMIAVPYWGVGAADLLSIKPSMSLRIICNIDQVGCNPDVIADLIKIGIAVRTHPRLHAKIYATERGVIIGSSNVSSNGLSIEGEAARGWVEANLYSEDPAIITEAQNLFEELWSSTEARAVLQVDIERARRARAKVRFFASAPVGTIFEACRAQPDIFSDVYVAPYDSGLSKNASRMLKAVKDEAQPPKEGISSSDFSKAWAYQLNGINEGDWLIDLSCKTEGKERVYGSSRATGLRLRPDEEDELTITIRQPIDVGGKKFNISSLEKSVLQQYGQMILEEAAGAVISLPDVLKLIDRQKHKSQL